MKMLKTILLTCTLIVFSVLSSAAQECFGIQIKEGGGFEMANFDSKGKPAGTLKYKFTNVKQEGDFTVIEIHLESLSNKGKSEYSQKFTMKCNGNESHVDAASMIMEDQLKSFESFNLKMTSNDIVYPNQLSVGQKLPDASLNGVGSMSGIPVTVDMKVSNRQVAAKEKVNVAAGEFDAFKITTSNTMSTKTIANINFEFETVSYRAPGILWDIKSETYRKGKLMARSELIKIY